jgi:hypothetical protein
MADGAVPQPERIAYADFEKVDVRVGRISEVLTLGLPDANGAVVLLMPTREVPLGGKLF